ncbi:hypothetical protein D1970_00385 [Mesobacillus zeae]|uniref:Uncharacterized protein n=2 Tax=Mesobacillus zeae TaxID=1917180 RepID=A0A398BNQ4_9BACI|nr:hypothetical protein D1970_00385 [Mesobacillus zeae]
MNKDALNSLVLRYKRERTDEIFNEIYREVSASWRNLHTVGKSVMSDESEILATYEDTLLKCIELFDENKGDFEHMWNSFIWRERRAIYRKKKRLYYYEVPESSSDNDDDDFSSFFNKVHAEFNTEELALGKKKADQRMLIDSLLNGADESTTAIVETFLAHPKPTATAIAKELGVHHSKVIRALNRLAGKFSTKQFGDYHDYLIAL